MIKFLNLWLMSMLVLLILHQDVLQVYGQTQPESKTPPKCKREADKKLGFSPKAITLKQLNVRAQPPEYSFLKGQWILGQPIDVLDPDTCLSILEKRMVGVIQIWYLILYKKNNKLKNGWVWGGTKDIDDTQYIGGDTTPEVEDRGRNHSSLHMPTDFSIWRILVSPAHAQADLPSSNISIPTGQTIPGLTEVKETGFESYVEIPVIGWPVSVGFVSGILLFLFMVAGMLAKAVWDQTEGGKVKPPLVKILRPILISPIAFSAFWGPMYIQKGSAGVSLTMILYAFQIGFMWQHILEKRVTAGTQEKT